MLTITVSDRGRIRKIGIFTLGILAVSEKLRDLWAFCVSVLSLLAGKTLANSSKGDEASVLDNPP